MENNRNIIPLKQGDYFPIIFQLYSNYIPIIFRLFSDSRGRFQTDSRGRFQTDSRSGNLSEIFRHELHGHRSVREVLGHRHRRRHYSDRIASCKKALGRSASRKLSTNFWGRVEAAGALRPIFKIFGPFSVFSDGLYLNYTTSIGVPFQGQGPLLV